MMNEAIRAEIEEMIVWNAKRFPQINEVVYNDSHPNPDGPATRRDSYFFVGGMYNVRLEDMITRLQIDILRECNENVGLMWLPVTPEHKRRIYSRRA
jgi:hypothetical protein